MHIRLLTRLAGLAIGFSLAVAHAQAPATSDRIMPLEVVVNGAASGVWLLVEREGQLYAPIEAYEEWRLNVPANASTIEFKGQKYWPLAAVPGFRSRIDFARQAVELVFSPQAFATSRLSQSVVKKEVVSEVLPSVFLNFDTNLSTSTFRGGPRINDVGALGEVGVSSDVGVLTTSVLARNLTLDRTLGVKRGGVRLETTFTRDFPSTNHTLRLGDTVTRGAMWGREVYFGGVRFGSNFALTPGFVSQPLPALSGLSAAPSTVELYVNDVLRQVSNVPAGPFAIDSLPTLTGNGEARLVVRDLLGRETVIVQPFFTSSQLLSPGLDDWSTEGGWVRRDLGVASDRYAQGFASGTWRRGITAGLTLEGRAEASHAVATLGAGAVAALPAQMLGKLALAASHDRDRGANGGLWLVGLERQDLRVGVLFQAQGSTQRFRQLGQEPEIPSTKLQVAGSAHYYSDAAGAFGAGFATLQRHGEERITTLSANYSLRLGARSNLAITASHALGGARGSAIGLTFITPLGDQRAVSVTANSREGQQDLYASASQNATPSDRLGWRALAGILQDHARAEGGLYYMGPHGNLSADATTSANQSVLRAGASGGLVFADGRFFATRRVEESFAIAEVKGLGDVGIGLGSNVLARTDTQGIALIPQLLPYQPNSVRIDPRELPVSAEIDTIELMAVPAWRSGVKLVFPVRSGRGALLRIVFDDGEPAPAGAIVRLAGDKETFYVARRGEAFVTGLQPANRLVLEWNGRECAFELALPPATADEIARVGPLQCKGVPR